ncbi:hypothetical protein COO91_10820 (plasmid) [Nostoc flagelliforme CCNUN1]|uniref:Uncharacterized protein n=1 Tax=Nostoc flagelliforme CCNUN1 TaxID=2038116 RepID=A0A2K8TA89_9NOSO|nr:hypothetical protein COO91_10820 [Nostoc flagelliforme CCNUN1]
MVIYSSADDGEIRYELMKRCTKTPTATVLIAPLPHTCFEMKI